MCHGVFVMPDSVLLESRHFGGCGILWNKDIAARIVPVECKNERLCAIQYLKDIFSAIIFSL